MNDIKNKTTEELLKEYKLILIKEGKNEEFKLIVQELLERGVVSKQEIREVRYYNANGYAVAIVAVFTHPIDWAVYIGGTRDDLREMETVEWVSKWGCKLAERDASYYFPNIKLTYRS